MLDKPNNTHSSVDLPSLRDAEAFSFEISLNETGYSQSICIFLIYVYSTVTLVLVPSLHEW